ncbi:MAG: NADH-quinone oxidoreductase subunit L, partial [Alphaproteobacteria bacterium]|nr:NADH-quinone oxidoreductase subunit L [Alphaproteobacteria bacterium]
SAVLVSIASPWLYTGLVGPAVAAMGASPFEISQGVFGNPAGAFAVLPLFAVVVIGFLFALKAMGNAKVTPAAMPYMGGLQNESGSAYIGPMNKEVPITSGHYYMTALFGEEKLSRWVNGGAVALLALMFVMGGMQ